MDWNAVRFDPASESGHVESHFLKLNDAEGRRALWLKTTILRPIGAAPVAEAWAIAFDRVRGHAAAKHVVPWASSAFSRDALDVRVGDVRLASQHTHGALVGAGGPVEWDLAFSGDAAPFVFLPARFYADRARNSKLVTPHPDLRFTGHYSVGGHRVAVDGWRGMQGHNWGHRHTHAYAWAHCNVWRDAGDLVVEGITARVKLGPLVSPPITLLVAVHEGRRHDFLLPHGSWRARGRIGARSWEVRAKSASARLHATFSAATEDFVGLHYENPDGAMTYCLNSKIATGALRLEAAGRAPVEAHTEAAALEIATRNPDHGVRMVA